MGGGFVGLLDTGVRTSHTTFAASGGDHIDFLRDLRANGGTTCNDTAAQEVDVIAARGRERGVRGAHRGIEQSDEPAAHPGQRVVRPRLNAPEAVDHVVVRVGVGGRFLTCLLQLERGEVVELQRRL